MLPGLEPEGGAPGEVKRSAEGKEAQRLMQIEAMREQVSKYVAAKGKGNNADLMKAKQALPNLLTEYMKNLQ
jgi:hypothetical protein